MVTTPSTMRARPTESSEQGPAALDASQVHPHRRLTISPFWAHVLEMSVVMWIGMAAGNVVFRTLSDVSSNTRAYQLYPWQAVLSMGISMTLPMVIWMLVRGHGWRNSGEMAAVMLVPGVPFVILCSLHVLTGGSGARAYMMLSVLAMLGLMFYRRDVYSMHMPAPWHRRSRETPR